MMIHLPVILSILYRSKYLVLILVIVGFLYTGITKVSRYVVNRVEKTNRENKLRQALDQHDLELRYIRESKLNDLYKSREELMRRLNEIEKESSLQKIEK